MMDTTSMDSSTMTDDSESHGQPQKRHLFRSRHYNPYLYGYPYGNGFPYGSHYGYGSQYGYGSPYGYGSLYGYGYPFRSHYRRFGPRSYNPLVSYSSLDSLLYGRSNSYPYYGYY